MTGKVLGFPHGRPPYGRVTIQFDLLGDAAKQFARMLAERNQGIIDPDKRWTPSMLAQAICNEVLLDDAAAHDVSVLN